MNKTSRTNEPRKAGLGGVNQSPDRFSNDLTTNQDFGDNANNTALGKKGGRALRGAGLESLNDDSLRCAVTSSTEDEPAEGQTKSWLARRFTKSNRQHSKGDSIVTSTTPVAQPGSSSRSQPANFTGDDDNHPHGRGPKTTLQALKQKLLTYFYFVGPGFMISVAYSKKTTNVSHISC